MPDDKAPKTKYFTPDSAEYIETLFIAATTYNDKLCISMARYIIIKLLEPIINIMPKVENIKSIKTSNLANLFSKK